MNSETQQPTAETLSDHLEVNQVAQKTGMASRFWKDRAKAGEVVGYRLGNRIVLNVESVNRFLEANRIKRLELPAHLRLLGALPTR